MNVYQMLQEMMQENHTRKMTNLNDISINPSLLPDNKDHLYNKLIKLKSPVQNIDKPLQDVLNERIAVKNYEPAPIKLEDLSTVLATIEESDKHNWSTFRQLGIQLSIYVLARNIENLAAPRIYKYIANKHALQIVSKNVELLEQKLDSIILQKEFIKAPAIILCTGMVGASIDAFNSHGYRQMLIRGGNAMNTAWMSSITFGYQGSIFAGFYHDTLQELFGIDGYKEMLLLAFAFGR